MTKSSEIKAKQLELQQQINEFEKQRQKALVEEGKAYNCKKCKSFVDKESGIGSGSLEAGLCNRCFLNMRTEEENRKILNKIKFGKIIDIEINGLYGINGIQTLVVYKNGMLYDLKPDYDSDTGRDPYIRIRHEYADQHQYKLEDGMQAPEKPWQKKRKEKPLIKK